MCHPHQVCRWQNSKSIGIHLKVECPIQVLNKLKKLKFSVGRQVPGGTVVSPSSCPSPEGKTNLFLPIEIIATGAPFVKQ